MRVLLFGDSIAFGRNDPRSGGWANLLGKYIDSREGKNVFFNLSVPFETSRGLYERFKSEAIRRIGDKPKKEVIILIAVGINDSSIDLKTNLPRTSLDEFSRNMAKTIETSKKLADKTIIIGLTTVDQKRTLPFKGLCNYTNSMRAKYDKALEEQAHKANIPYLCLSGGVLTEDMLSDGLHPNKEGHQRIYCKVKEMWDSEMDISK
jgi:acyl-CoA thioesterase I